MQNAYRSSAEKALLLVTLGFLEALRAGVIVGDEAFYIIGIPSIMDRMAAHGISADVANLVGQLDEFEPLGALSGSDSRDRAIQDAISDCLTLLKLLPLDPNRTMPVLNLLA